MKPLYLVQASIKEEYDRDVGMEIVREGNEMAFFITRDTPIIVTPYEARGLRKLVGEASFVNTPATQYGVMVIGSVDWVAKEIRDHFERRYQ